MATWWMMGGVFMWVVLLLGLVGLVVSVAAVALAVVGRLVGGVWQNVARVVAVVAVLVAALPGLAGVAGWLQGRSAVEAALQNVDPAYAEQIRTAGYAEAQVPLQFGGGTTLPLVGLAFLALILALPPTRRGVDAEPGGE